MSRSIIQTLNQINGGVLMHDFGEKLAELVQAVEITGKPGKITLELNLRKSTQLTMAASGAVKVTKPKEPLMETLLFPTPEGNLLTENPRQINLPLQVVQTPTADQLLQQSPAPL